MLLGNGLAKPFILPIMGLYYLSLAKAIKVVARNIFPSISLIILNLLIGQAASYAQRNTV